MNRVLVLGGGGFVGEPLVNALCRAGESVTAPTRSELDIGNDSEKLAKALGSHDTLIILTQPNEKGINNVVPALALSRIQHILYASTALVYGSSVHPQREDAPIAPSSDYARQKYAEEEALRRNGGVPLTVVRLGNVYGGPKNKGIVQKAIVALRRGEPLHVSGEAQVRDFIHVDDVVRAICALSKLPPKQARVVNVMTGTGTTIGDMFAMLERLAGKKLLKIKGVEEENLSIVGNIDTLKKLIGFSPQISLEEGLKKTLYTYDRTFRK